MRNINSMKSRTGSRSITTSFQLQNNKTGRSHGSCIFYVLQLTITKHPPPPPTRKQKKQKKNKLSKSLKSKAKCCFLNNNVMYFHKKKVKYDGR